MPGRVGIVVAPAVDDRADGTGGLDAVAAHPDGPPLMHYLTIEDPGGHQHYARTSRGGLGGERQRDRGDPRDGRERTAHGALLTVGSLC